MVLSKSHAEPESNQVIILVAVTFHETDSKGVTIVIDTAILFLVDFRIVKCCACEVSLKIPKIAGFSRRHSCRQPRLYLTLRTTNPQHELSTFRMNTCKSVSKQRTLGSFRMNTYAKTGGGGPHLRPEVVEFGGPFFRLAPLDAPCGTFARNFATPE